MTISTLKKKNKIKRELLSKIEWACSLNAIKLEHEMILRNNSEDVKVLVKYFESLSIEDNLKLSIIVIQSDLIKLKTDKEKLVDILKNFLCVFDKNYNKNTMLYYNDNMDVFILAKVM